MVHQNKRLLHVDSRREAGKAEVICGVHVNSRGR